MLEMQSTESSSHPCLNDDELEGLERRGETEPELVGDVVTHPFDPSLIRITTKTPSLDTILQRIHHGEIDMSPDFQRKAGIWTDVQQSRLIESLLIKIPLPAFYMDASNDDRWLVVDGLQRLTALKRFVNLQQLRLRGMEFLKQLDGLAYADIPRNFQRRINETQITVYLIDPGTPSEVKFNIFSRINTGGLPLSAQEIRHALNQGPATRLLQEMAESEEFKTATRNAVRDDRMADRECVARFFAFILTAPEKYGANDLDAFLNDAMKQMNAWPQVKLDEYKARFRRAMHNAGEILGEHAFRKYHPCRRMPINKALFEAWSVGLDGLSDHELYKLKERRDRLLELWAKLSNIPEFIGAVSASTGDEKRIRTRFQAIKNIITEALCD